MRKHFVALSLRRVGKSGFAAGKGRHPTFPPKRFVWTFKLDKENKIMKTSWWIPGILAFVVVILGIMSSGNSILAQTTEGQEKGDKSKKNNLLAEYQVIVDKNLFRPLGWGGEKPNNPFRLVGTVIDSSSQKGKAIITRGENPEIFFVSEGDIIGNGYKVEEISANKVKLANAEKGENLVIQFAWTPLGGQPSKESSRGNSGRSENESTRSRAENRKPSANRGKGQSRDSRKSTGERTLSKQEIEAWTNLKQSSAWQNASPEQQKQMAEDLQSRLGDKNESSDSGGKGSSDSGGK